MKADARSQTGPELAKQVIYTLNILASKPLWGPKGFKKQNKK